MFSITPNWTRSVFAKAQGGSFKLTLWDQKTIKIGSGKPAFHLHIKKPDVINQLVRSPQLGFGESYMSGDVDVVGDLSALLALAIKNQQRFAPIFNSMNLVSSLAKRFNRPTPVTQQRKDIAHHYDLGNDFYKLWLDKQMVYSCAYFKTKNDTIDQAQRQKIDHSLAKLRLKKGEHLFDVGSGWGATIINAAKKYGVKATGITLSKEQVKWTRERIKKEGLSRLVNVEYMDYREIPKSWHGKFDKWISIGMYEHVGKANWPVFIKQIKNVLKPAGVGLLHSITGQEDKPGNPFLLKYIFPGGHIPPIYQMIADLQAQGFYVLDLENLWQHYALTLNRWLKNFEQNVETVRSMYGEPFARMWRLYLAGSEQSFKLGPVQVVQILFSNGSPKFSHRDFAPNDFQVVSTITGISK